MDLVKWRADLKAQLTQSMTDMIPKLVEDHVMELLEPMNDLEESRSSTRGQLDASRKR